MKTKLPVDQFQNLSDMELTTLLVESDKNMARVVEDAINAMIKNGIIQPRDLPDCAREVLEARAELRCVLEKRRKS